MTLSTSRSFNPNLGEAVIGAFARIGVRRTEVTQQHLADAEFESNLLQSDMQGDGINLYQVTLQVQDLIAGQGQYRVDPTVVFMLDVYIRQNPQVYGVGWTNTNQTTEPWTNYDVDTSIWTNGSQSQTLPKPPQTTGTVDRIIIPISRTDYASIANKYMTGFPTSYWYNKQLNPIMNLWPIPNQDIPGGLQYYVQRRPTNAELQDGTQLQLPYEVFDYYVWALAERLAYIYDPSKIPTISSRKQMAWQRYLQATTENVPINMDVDVKSYYRVG